MGCCGCADDSSTKTPENEEMASNNGDQIFVSSRDRSCTDPLALVILFLLVGGFGFLMNTAIKKGDIYRIVYGYDDCANVCGRVTPSETNPLFSCKGADKRKEPYLWLDIEGDGVKSRQCVANCSTAPDRMLFLNRCLPKTVTGPASNVIRKLGLDSFFREVTMDLNSCWHELIHLLLIALGISICILIAFRYIVQWVVYIVLIGVIIACIAGSTFFWLIWHHEKKLVEKGEVHPEDSHVQPYFVYAIIMTVVTVITVLIVLVMRKRIALVMQLFRETGKAVYAMPALLLQPILTYLLIGCAMAAWVYCMLWIESAGDLYKNRKNHFHYKKDAMLISLRWYNLFLFFVACEFFLGCQHMVIASAVAQWFFTRDKRRLSLPVIRGFGYLTRFHLGTVAFGAMVIGIVRLIRSMLAWIQNRLKRYENDFVKAILWCCQCCLWCFECALKFLTRNAYIETAIYGCNFCTGGQKAFKALASNILRVAAINSVGDFVLFLGKVLVVVLTCVIGVHMIEKKAGLHHPWVPIVIAGVLAFVVAHCFISVYEMIIDTIFICFCEDCEKNDGINRPYFMSRGLMEFVENSKKALRQLDQSS